LHWDLWWLEKLVRLREARPNIAFRGLSREWHLPLAILLHYSDLVFNNNGLVDHVMEVGVVSVKQLELNPFKNTSYFFSSVLMSSGAYLDN
jgi:hypothetical protein